MLKELDHLEIPIRGNDNGLKLLVYPQSSNAKVFEENEPYAGESKYQLLEGCTYAYEFIDDTKNCRCQFKQKEVIRFHPNKTHHACEGTITTGIYVGNLPLEIDNPDNQNQEKIVINLEIRSTKADYRRDYRLMLNEIAEYYADLVLQQGSPVTQKLEIDPSCSSQTLYQRFSFVRSLIDSDAFSEAIHKIISNPVRKWTDASIEKNIVGVKRLTRNNLKQIASSTDRIPLSKSIQAGFSTQLSSVPRKIEVEYKRDTTDIQENQFVKFVLRSFINFCSDIQEYKNASDILKAEAQETQEKLYTHLDNQFFRQISMPQHMNMNSPVLQRKEGYREVLQAWLLYDLAAKLNWTGGDDVYNAGKKNVATLYEYWLFFKLLELVSEFFNIKAKDKSELIEYDKDKINLSLKQGHIRMVYGQQETFSRILNVAFYYNRTFKKESDDDESMHKAGSWTMAMRPDYTLSIWPGRITEAEAEKQELIVHIHFDAKYRLDKILLEDKDIEEDMNEELAEEKKQQELKIYKRGDLLKMHAYKDAIRRTSGAYVLYPGDKDKEIRGFHEIVPGLGAFKIRPGHWQEDSVSLKLFLAEVKAHLLNRASDREKLSYYQYEILRESNKTMVMQSLPEAEGENRDFLPDETTVIVAYYKNQKHLDWILSNHQYNMRAGDDKGSMELNNALINARYLLLHDGKRSLQLIRIIKGGPKVFTRAQLIKQGYPPYFKIGSDEIDTEKEAAEANRIYLLFKLFKNNTAEKELQNYIWDTKDIVPKGMKRRSFTTNLVDLIRKAKTFIP